MADDIWERVAVLLAELEGAELEAGAARLPEHVRATIPCTGASEDALSRAGQRLGFPLPDQLARWLRICNGSYLGPGGLLGIETVTDFLDLEHTLASVSRLWPEWRVRRWIPVAGDGCGDYYVLDASAGKPWPSGAVFFVDHEDFDRLAYVVASALPRFLCFLFDEELQARPRRLEPAPSDGADWRAELHAQIRAEPPSWPFHREYVLERDPDLASFPAALLPWLDSLV